MSYIKLKLNISNRNISTACVSMCIIDGVRKNQLLNVLIFKSVEKRINKIWLLSSSNDWVGFYCFTLFLCFLVFYLLVAFLKSWGQHQQFRTSQRFDIYNFRPLLLPSPPLSLSFSLLLRPLFLPAPLYLLTPDPLSISHLSASH